MKILQVIEQAFRVTVEEQDDAILWLTRSMLGAGAQLSVLLSGNAALYAVLQSRQPALTLGDWQQTEPADLRADVVGLVEADVPVYVVAEELAALGVANRPVVEGVCKVARRDLPQLYGQVDQVWHW